MHQWNEVMSNGRALISIALATYNGARFLQEQLDSLALQLAAPFELVVTDDGSTDNTISVIQEFAKTAPFSVSIVCNTERLGYGRNFLKAASLCKGTHIAFCDQEDVWLPRKLHRAYAALEQQAYDLIAHSAKVVDQDLNWLGDCFPDIQNDRTFDGCENQVTFFWPGFTLIASKALVNSINIPSTNPEDSLFAHDELICKFAQNLPCHLIAEPLALYRQHGNNLIGFDGAIQAQKNSPSML